MDFFKSAGIEEAKAKHATVAVGAIMVFMTFVTIPLIDRLGRRILQITSLGEIFNYTGVYVYSP